MKYKIYYTFDGNGTALLEAKNDKEAQEMFFGGNAMYQDGTGENYEIDFIEKDESNK